MSNPYLIAAKQTLERYMNKPWLHGWMWAVEVSAPDAPTDFDMYVKDVSFGAGSIDVDTVQIGSGHISFPTARSASEITLTARDDQNQTLSKWMDSRLAKVSNQDGTINIPIDYVFTMTFYTLNDQGVRTKYKSYQVYPTKKGDLTWAREDTTSLMMFPLVFQKFSSVGSKVLS